MLVYEKKAFQAVLQLATIGHILILLYHINSSMVLPATEISPLNLQIILFCKLHNPWTLDHSCCGRSLFMPLRNVSRIRFPPDKSVTAGSVINNIKLWSSGWWYNVSTDFPAALAGTSSPSVLLPLDIMISSLCDWVPSLISWVCWRVFLLGPFPRHSH